MWNINVNAISERAGSNCAGSAAVIQSPTRRPGSVITAPPSTLAATDPAPASTQPTARVGQRRHGGAWRLLPTLEPPAKEAAGPHVPTSRGRRSAREVVEDGSGAVAPAQHLRRSAVASPIRSPYRPISVENAETPTFRIAAMPRSASPQVWTGMERVATHNSSAGHRVAHSADTIS